MYFLRILLPSWRLFDDTGPIPKLYARTEGSSSWLPALTPPRWRWYSIFLNPEGNLYHAACNSLERLLHEPNHRPSEQIVHKIVRWNLLKKWGMAPGTVYQFKVTAVEFSPEGTASESDILLSAEERL